MKVIELTQGKVSLVDDADFVWLSQWKWCATKRKLKYLECWYAVRNKSTKDGCKGGPVYMHREIAATIGIPQVDHRDGDGLNNQRNNLRPATQTQNNGNQRKVLVRSSRFKGVVWNKKRQKWYAQVQLNGAQRYLGCFTVEEEAAKVYDTAAQEVFGQFAKLNFPSNE